MVDPDHSALGVEEVRVERVVERGEVEAVVVERVVGEGVFIAKRGQEVGRSKGRR